MNTAKLAIIQTTRTGDIIQTLQAVRQYRAENPNVSVSLIARKQFAKGIEFLTETVFDKIFYIETKELFAQRSFSQAHNQLKELINEINNENFDYVANFSFNKSSSYLSSLIKSKNKLGLYRNNQAQIGINDSWSQYIYSNVMNHNNSSFSLVDIYKYTLGVQGTHILDSSNDDESTRTADIVVHPFASNKKKRWGANKWSELIFKLMKDCPGHTVHIVGTVSENDEANRIVNSPAISKYRNRIKLHTNGESIADCYKLLMRAKLFIGHDSMVSHLASETLTPSIVLSLGSVRPQETTPYQANVINIVPKNSCFPCNISDSCELLPCHNSIGHQVVAVIAKGILNKIDINTSYLKENLTPFHLGNINIYKTSFTDLVGLELNQITENYLTDKEVFREFYKVIWQYYLRNIDVETKLPEITANTATTLYNYIAGSNYLYELYNFGVKYSNNIVKSLEETPIPLDKVQENINKLGEIDQLCSITKKTYPLLSGLVDYFYVNKANALGDNLDDISKHNLLNYYDASNLAAVIHEFVEKSVLPHITMQNKNKDV